MMHFYDFEVFKYEWLVVIINPTTNEKTFIVNDKKRLREYYEAHKNEIWVGFNSREYDQYILKGLLLDFDPYKITDFIISKKKRGWMYSSLFNKIQLYNYDCFKGENTPGLKTLEAFMGNDIKETDVPFNINRKLTPEEITQTINYCTHDVEQTIQVFLRRKSDFEAHMGIISIFDLPLSFVNKTMAQLTAHICGGKRLSYEWDREFDFRLLPFVNHIKKYKYVVDWYREAKSRTEKLIEEQYTDSLETAKTGSKKREIKKAKDFIDKYKMDYQALFKELFYSQSLEVVIDGIVHKFAWGGLHAGDTHGGEGIYLLADVSAYYPSMAKKYKLGYECMERPENFEKIHDENLRFKALGDKVARLPYKIADNAITGQFKQKDSALYCPHENNAITVNGQLGLLLLLEMTEPYAQLVQSNTDGLMWKLKSMDDYELFDDIVYEWEQITGMTMEFSLFKRVYQKDVNNYVAVGFNGKAKRKGGYVKDLSDIDNDLPIINKAMVEYMVNEVPIEETINGCNQLIDFQKVVKLSGKYDYVEHNGVKYNYKSYRVFASKNNNDGQILKCKQDKKDKFANTPNHCFINNDDINGLSVPPNLDKSYYVDLTRERLRQYGVL